MVSSQWPGGNAAVLDGEASLRRRCWSEDLEEVKGQSMCDLSEEHSWQRDRKRRGSEDSRELV